MKPLAKDLITAGILITLLFIACVAPIPSCSEKVDPEPIELMTPLERAERMCEGDTYYDSCVRIVLRRMESNDK